MLNDDVDDFVFRTDDTTSRPFSDHSSRNITIASDLRRYRLQESSFLISLSTSLLDLSVVDSKYQCFSTRVI